jgi:hypothetical protein
MCVGIVLMLGVLFLSSGCEKNKIGGSFSTDPNGRPNINNPSPVTLTIEDEFKKGTANGIGPARYTSISDSTVETFQTGTTPRDLTLSLPNGARLNLSSGTDIQMTELSYSPETGAISVGSFGTNASEPLKAGNEAYDRLVAYWAARDEASKEAILAELKTIEASAGLAGGVLGDLIRVLGASP